MYTIILQEEDFLQFQLYKASKSERVRKVRIRSWLLLSVSFLFLGVILIKYDNHLMMYYCFGVGTMMLFFYPFYQRWRYKLHYLKHIRESAKDKIGKEAKLELQDEILKTSDDVGDGQFKLAELDSITEIATHIFIQTNAGDTLVIPKSIDNVDDFIQDLKRISEKFEIIWKQELDWRWK